MAWDFRYWRLRKQEKLMMWIAWHLPLEIYKWAVVRAVCDACGENKVPDEVDGVDILKASVPRRRRSG
jgi:hypothetical protein